MRDDWRNAAVEGDRPIIERMLDVGAMIDARDRYGQTALMLAALHGREEVVELLLRHGAALDVTAKHNLSALMLAAINGRIGIAKRLVDAGANLELSGSGAPGFAGKTARDLAEHAGHADLVAYIAEASRSA